MRGVRALIKRTMPGKLAGSGKFACFRKRTDANRATGPKLRGITKLLTSRLHSSSTLPSKPSLRGGAWSGAGGGLRRGKAVDAQVSRLANASAVMRKHSKMLKIPAFFSTPWRTTGSCPWGRSASYSTRSVA